MQGRIRLRNDNKCNDRYRLVKPVEPAVLRGLLSRSATRAAESEATPAPA